MHSKLLVSRCSEPKEVGSARALTSAGKASPAISASRVSVESNTPSGKSVLSSKEKTQLSMEALATLVSMERGGGRQGQISKEINEGISRIGLPPGSAFMRPGLFELSRLSEAAPGPGNNHTSLQSHSAALSMQSALLAARMADEQETLALYLQQRQKASLGLQLEQFRRIQAASMLYGPGAGAPSVAALHHLDSLLAARHTQLAVASDLAQAQHLLQAQHYAGGVLPSSVPLSSTSGTMPNVLAMTNKRGIDAFTSDKLIIERPGDYQHLSKKARTALSQHAVAKDHGRPPADSGVDEDALYEAEEEKNGHRFRAYQFEQWTEKFQELCDFRKVKGHCQVPHTYKENPSLARWVKRQRYQYKLKTENKMSTMTDQRAKLLEDIGFIWDSHAAAWAEKLHELKDYAVVKGDCNVPSTYPENHQLATWVKCQRRQYKLLRANRTSNMTVERVIELEKIGFVWEVRKSGDREST